MVWWNKPYSYMIFEPLEFEWSLAFHVFFHWKFIRLTSSRFVLGFWKVIEVVVFGFIFFFFYDIYVKCKEKMNIKGNGKFKYVLCDIWYIDSIGHTNKINACEFIIYHPT